MQFLAVMAMQLWIHNIAPELCLQSEIKYKWKALSRLPQSFWQLMLLDAEGHIVLSKKCMFQKWTIYWQNKSLIYVFWWGLVFHLISVSDRGEMQFDRKVGFERGSCHSQKLSNDLGVTSRSGAFNDLAQININTKPWNYYNQIELMCSVNW